MFESNTDTKNNSISTTNYTDDAHPITHPVKPSTISPPSNKKRRDKAPSVAMATLPSTPTVHDKLVDDAVKAGETLNRLLKDGTDKAENQSRDLIRRMLLVRESFEANGAFDEETFREFVERKAPLGRGKVKNPWQRLAKVCVPKGTKAPQVSKLGYVLAALVKRDIGSKTVMDEFDDEGPVGESGRDFTGLDRFVRLYKQDNPASGDAANPLLKWGKERLVEHAHLLFDALRENKLLNPKIQDVDDFMAPL